jgi:hypothetical protein
MLTQQKVNINSILQHIAESLDISPTDYERAVRSYMAVGSCLENGFAKGFYPESSSAPNIYPQGSINLGTIVRPYRDGKEAGEYDVDLVCEIQTARARVTPRTIKHQAGDCLKDNDTYRDKLDDEGKRCWTLTYAESAGIGFHLDVLPCVAYPPDDHPRYPGAISITNRYAEDYEWKAGNPQGYGEWFRDQNVTFEKFAAEQKRNIFDQFRSRSDVLVKYAQIDDIPDQLVRTPLQRAVQLMKRHRDMRFSANPKYKPISIIITTLAAHLYSGEEDVYSALFNIVEQLGMHSGLVEDRFFAINEKMASRRLITRNARGEWEILNPVNGGENFADRWHEDDHARAKAFFQWVKWLSSDISRLPIGEGLPAVDSYLRPLFGERATKEAAAKWGDALRVQRQSGRMSMNPGTGLLGTAGGIAVKDHNFHGEEDT